MTETWVLIPSKEVCWFVSVLMDDGMVLLREYGMSIWDQFETS